MQPGNLVIWQGIQYNVFMVSNKYASIRKFNRNEDGTTTKLENVVLISQLKLVEGKNHVKNSSATIR